MIASRIALLCFLLTSACAATGQQQPQEISACELLRGAERFDGQFIETRLIVGNSFHALVMFAPQCNMDLPVIQPVFVPPYSIESKEDKAFRKYLSKYGAVWATVRGRLIASGGPFGAMGRALKLEVASVRDVQKVSEKDRERWSIGTGKVPK